MSSLSSLRSSTSDDIDDEELDLARSGTPPAPTELTSDALARCMMEAVVLTARLRRLLKSPPSLILIRTADEAAARLLDTCFSGLDRAPKIQAYTEPQKTGGRLESQGRGDGRRAPAGDPGGGGQHSEAAALIAAQQSACLPTVAHQELPP